MIINQVELKNVRSYTNSKVEFGNGKILLSGDIGSGKTTILLAIEFALFGLIRGVLNGSDLLRHGAGEGSVKLNFRIFDTNYTIYRVLKRTSTGISQDSGYLEINGQREQMVHTELKSKILEILGYPNNLLSKNKNLIFRYTSYTPQEEVKKILYESSETRLDIIRKIFGIDKYKNVKENTILLRKALKKDEEEYKIRSEGLIELEQKISLLKSNLESIKKETLAQTEYLEKELNEETKITEKLNSLELEIASVQEQNAKKKVVKSKIDLLTERKNRIEQNIKPIQELLELKDTKELNEKKELLTKKINELEQKYTEANNKLITNQTLKDSALKDANGILELNECLLCKQQVSHEHKTQIKIESEEKANFAQEKIIRLEEYIKKANENKKILTEKLELVTAEINQAKIVQLKNDQIKQNNENRKLQNEEIQQLTNEIKELQEKYESLETIQLDNTNYQLVKDKLDSQKEKINSIKIRLAELKVDLEHTTENSETTKAQYENAKEAQKKLDKVSTNREWLEKYFITTISNIERNIMLKVYHDFNSSFVDWFNILIEDDSITAKLDDTFSPYIIQNSEITTFNNLSGGEKTGLSLAYRLALNKVINDFLTNMNTRELLILDEPTDGFSAHQLDKIREVLDYIKSAQIIIVSHEPKLESYVDEIIRVSKTGHISHTT